ncbi:MAG TPA: type II secretion system minor pseudopilin GspJ [Pseudomonadales bacterium]|nr:type II secretion system minor pseudopilin GspJ [Pseudomonadales bacterium]
MAATNRSTQVVRTQGFTLIEVMVAISIFAVISLGVYRVLSGMVQAQGAVASHADSLHEIQQALWIMSSDIEQIAVRDIQDENKRRVPAVISDKDDFLLQFTRQGLRNPLLFHRSDLQRVAYSLGPAEEDDANNATGHGKTGSGDHKRQHLLRHVWGALDRIDETQEVKQVLLHDVDEVKLEFLTQDNKWLKNWPEKRMESNAHVRTLPVAIKIEMKTRKYGTLERVFQISNVLEKKKVKKEPAP